MICVSHFITLSCCYPQDEAEDIVMELRPPIEVITPDSSRRRGRSVGTVSLLSEE